MYARILSLPLQKDGVQWRHFRGAAQNGVRKAAFVERRSELLFPKSYSQDAFSTAAVASGLFERQRRKSLMILTRTSSCRM